MVRGGMWWEEGEEVVVVLLLLVVLVVLVDRVEGVDEGGSMVDEGSGVLLAITPAGKGCRHQRRDAELFAVGGVEGEVGEPDCSGHRIER